MSVFSKNQSSVLQLWQASVKLYLKAFAKIWHLGIIIAILNTALTLFNIAYKNQNISNKGIALIISLTVPFILIYLTSLLLIKLYDIGMEKDFSSKEAFMRVNTKYFKVSMGMLVVIILSNIVEMLVLIAPKLLFIPFTILQVFIIILLTLVQPLILFDNHGVGSSIKNSCQLVWGSWWRTFAVIFPVIIANYWMTFIVNTAVTNTAWYLAIISGIVIALFCPLFYGCILTIFNDLKLRKDIGSANNLQTATTS